MSLNYGMRWGFGPAGAWTFSRTRQLPLGQFEDNVRQLPSSWPPRARMPMNRWTLAIAILLAAGSWAMLAEAPAAKTHQVQLNGHTFTLPAGFDIELVAGPPLVDRPIVADFDEQGRLYVADSSGSNEKVADPASEEAAPHRPPGRHRRRRHASTRAPSSPTR